MKGHPQNVKSRVAATPVPKDAALTQALKGSLAYGVVPVNRKKSRRKDDEVDTGQGNGQDKRKAKATAPVKTKAGPSATLVSDEVQPRSEGCLCGCGSPVNARRRFAQGHDARLKGHIIRAWRKGGKVVISVVNQLFKTDDPQELAHHLGWGRFLTELKGRKRQTKEQQAGKEETK